MMVFYFMENLKSEYQVWLNILRLCQNEEIEIDQSIVDEVNKAYKRIVEKELTPEQKQIAELKAMIEDMKSESKPKAKKQKDNTPNINEELEEARNKYKEASGKKPHHLWTLERINKEIEELK